MKAILESASYQLLRRLSHSRNRLTNAEIAAQAAQRPYDPETPNWFLGLAGKHIDYHGKTVLDIGCGYGDLCIWLAKTGADRAVGIDIDPIRIACAQKNAQVESVEPQVRFACTDFVGQYEPETHFDYVFSLDAFEHVVDIGGCLQKAYACLKSGGSLVTLFGPLWYSPYGAHMVEFTGVPWVHLMFPETVVLRVRTEYYRPDQPAERYEDVVGHLSRMTVERFRACALQAGFKLRQLRINPDKDYSRGGMFRPLNALINTVPILRELGAQLLLAILEK